MSRYVSVCILLVFFVTTVGALRAGHGGPPSDTAPEFGHPNGGVPQNLGEIFGQLRALPSEVELPNAIELRPDVDEVAPEDLVEPYERPYDLQLLISFGTSKGGSAGHLALAIRDQADGGDDDLVYSANFYADRKHTAEDGYYVDDLMAKIPMKEYLYGDHSTVSPNGSFGLDYGEAYKRSLIGIRFYIPEKNERNPMGPEETKRKLAAFFDQMNEDFYAEKEKTDYHKGPIVYDYMLLNCAKTIGLGFKYGLDWKSLWIRGDTLVGRLIRKGPHIKGMVANVPTSMTMRIMKEAAKRGWGIEAVLYKKHPLSTYVNSHDEGGHQYKDLPNRFPSRISTDYKKEQGAYESMKNLHAIYLYLKVGRYSVRFDEETDSTGAVVAVHPRLVIEAFQQPMKYEPAYRTAKRDGKRDGKYVIQRAARLIGVKITDDVSQSGLTDFDGKGRTPTHADIIGPIEKGPPDTGK